MIRGIRGATTVENDQELEVIHRTRELMEEMMAANSLEIDLIASIFISVTPDVQAVFPARALREMNGFTYVPVMCMQEAMIEGAIEQCIRVMIHYNTTAAPSSIVHVYQHRAIALRPDLQS